MDRQVYVVIAFLILLVWIIVSLVSDWVLGRKTDNHSKIREESRKIHYVQNHNTRQIEENFDFFWKSRSDDPGIQKKLENHVASYNTGEKKKKMPD